MALIGGKAARIVANQVAFITAVKGLPLDYNKDMQESEIFFFFQAEDGIRDLTVTGVQTCALPISFNKCAGMTGPLQGTCKTQAEDAKKLGTTQLSAPK